MPSMNHDRAGRRAIRWWVAARRSVVTGLLALVTFSFQPSLGAAVPDKVTPAAMRSDRIIVRLSPHASPLAVQQLHASLDSKPGRRLGRGRESQLVQLPARVTVAHALATFRQSGLVEFAEPDFLLHALITPNDFHFQDQWNLHNTGIYGGIPGADIMAREAWEVQREAPDIIVAVIDSGVRYTHQDLAANMWVNPGESGSDALGRDKRSNGVDDDANGYVDDVHGINVLNGSGNPMDDWGHGTHVAGIVGAVGNNGVGVAGTAWRVKLMACKFITPAAQYSVSDAITCLDYAQAHGARIVTASWGGYAFTSTALREAISALREQGIIVAAAAGNDNSDNDTMPLYPASYDLDNIVTVAATDRTDTRAGFSNFGAQSVDLGAPGAPVFSTWSNSDQDYRYNDGTSMAAPHIAGACALLWTRFPGDTHQQIIQRIVSTVDVLPSLAGKTRSGGRLNLAAALAFPVALPAPSGLTATATSASTAALAWVDNSTTETGFEVQRSIDNVTFIVAGNLPANETSTSIGTLNGSTPYFFRVRALQNGTASAFSNTASAAPSGLKATATTSTSITLTWTDNSATETRFEVQRSTDNVTFVPAGTTAANATSTSVGSLNASTTYYFRVRAAQENVTSAFSNTASAVTPRRKGKP